MGVGARVAPGRSKLLYSASVCVQSVQLGELVFSNAFTIFGHFTPSHTTIWQVSLLRLTLLDNTSKLFLTDWTIWNRVERHRARDPTGDLAIDEPAHVDEQ